MAAAIFTWAGKDPGEPISPRETANGIDLFDGIARWDGSAWFDVGGGLSGWVNALAWDAANGHLYAGGYSNFDGRVWRWDGTAWTALGGGFSGGYDRAVRVLAWDATNSYLYAGGAFTFASGNPANRIARWDGTAWSALGSGMDDIVRTLAWDAENDHLYSGGGGNPISRWDGSVWSVLGDDLEGGAVLNLAWDAFNDRLYAGGWFNSAGGDSANGIAQWDGNTWSPLGGLSQGSVLRLTWDADSKQLYAGGWITIAGGQPGRFARMDARLHQNPPITAIAAPESIEHSQQSTLSVSGGAGTGLVSYAVIAGAEFCSLSGDTLTGTGFGTCTVTATRAGDDDYRPSIDSVDVTVHGVFEDRFEEL